MVHANSAGAVTAAGGRSVTTGAAGATVSTVNERVASGPSAPRAVTCATLNV